MDHYRRHELKKINPQSDEYTLVIYLDDHLTEFAEELDLVPREKRDIIATAKQIAKERYPTLKITMIKVIVGGMTVTSLPLLGANTSTAQAAESATISTQVSQSSSIYYQVAPGDTLWNISRKFNTSIDNIKRANNLTSDVMQINQRLIIPRAFHTVTTGDYLTVLAKNYGTTVDAIKEANGLTSDSTRLGQTLIIPLLPGGQTSEPAPSVTQPAAQTQATTYTVVSGDSLSVIAKRFGITVEALRSANNLTSDLVRLGQTLTIPAAGTGAAAPAPAQLPTTPSPPTEQSTINYTVVVGDSLWAIAKRFNVTVDGLRSVNNLSSDLLRIGQSLTIPTSGNAAKETVPVPAPAPAPTQTATVPTSANIQYTVVAGDSLWGISTKFNVSLDTLRSSNNLESDRLMVGQTLIIPKDSAGVLAPALTPATNTMDKIYTVAPGDTLTSVANKFNVTVEHLKQTNQLTSDTIQAGQVLTIPDTQTATTIETAPSAAADANAEAVHKKLQALGYYSIPTMTGNYDTLAVQAIKTFQGDYGLPVTGTVDEATRTAIDRATVKQALVKDTVNYTGVPYLWGGTTPSGFDCSGFIYYMFNQHGVNMPRNTSAGLFKTGTAIERSKLQPGDLVFFAVNTTGMITHVGFYTGNNQFISATSSKGIAAYSMDNTYWAKYYVGAKRIY